MLGSARKSESWQSLSLIPGRAPDTEMFMDVVVQIPLLSLQAGRNSQPHDFEFGSRCPKKYPTVTLLDHTADVLFKIVAVAFLLRQSLL